MEFYIDSSKLSTNPDTFRVETLHLVCLVSWDPITNAPAALLPTQTVRQQPTDTRIAGNRTWWVSWCKNNQHIYVYIFIQTGICFPHIECLVSGFGCTYIIMSVQPKTGNWTSTFIALSWLIHNLMSTEIYISTGQYAVCILSRHVKHCYINKMRSLFGFADSVIVT